MAKPIGSPKTGGRKRGTPNRKTAVLKALVEELSFNVPTRLSDLIPQLAPEKQADVLLSLMDFLYPKRKAVEYSGPQGSPIQISSRAEGIREILDDPDAFAAVEILESKLKGRPDGK